MEESEHKGWCDTEMGTNKQTREDKADSVSTLMAESEELSAKISKLSDEIAELSDAIAEIDAAVAEATALRTKEKAKNAVTIEEAKVAQVAVAKAFTQQAPPRDLQQALHRHGRRERRRHRHARGE